MARRTNFSAGILLGAGLMYFFDPVRGRRRRVRVNEAMRHAERVERALLGKAARDAKQRAQGLVERAKHRPSPDASDEVIEERVRACLGRAVSHPRALDVVVREGRVILRGPVLESEAAAIMRHVRSVSGVHEVVDRMELHLTPGTIPALQGEGRMRSERRSWSPAVQVAATGGGLAMMLYGWFLRRGVLGKLLGAAGGAFVLRGTVNRPMQELVGGGRGISVHKTITVQRPVHEVFDVWTRFEKFPLFMQHVRAVELEHDGPKSRWTVDGPAGSKLAFDVETVALEPDRLIAWRTTPHQAIQHEGRVRFEPADGGTRVHVDLTYRPPGGVIGHAIAHLLGWDPKARMDDDMVRMKALLEEGKTRAHTQRVELADLH